MTETHQEKIKKAIAYICNSSINDKDENINNLLENILKVEITDEKMNNTQMDINYFWDILKWLKITTNFFYIKFTTEFNSTKDLWEKIIDHPLAMILLLESHGNKITFSNLINNYNEYLDKTKDIIIWITWTRNTYIIDEQNYEYNLLFDILYKIFIIKVMEWTQWITDNIRTNLEGLTTIYKSLIKNYKIDTTKIYYNINLDPDSVHTSQKYKLRLNKFEEFLFKSKEICFK